MAEPGHDIPAVSLDLMAAPLQWFWAEHARHRRMCRLLDELADAGEVWPGVTETLLRYLEQEIPDHFRDEEDALFPRLRRRCTPQDSIGPVLASLAAEHKHDLNSAAEIAALLRGSLAKGVPPGADPVIRDRLHDFAQHERHHLALEDAVVLRIAKFRLSEADLGHVSRKLSEGRGYSGGR